MTVINYFEAKDRTHWLHEMEKSDWGAAHFLCDLLKSNTLAELTGEVRLLLLTEGDALISFCTLAARDDIQPTTFTPWIGWIYTFPAYRGHRYAALLLAEAERLAKADGHTHTYISTNHVGLYEKYGYTFSCMMKDVGGEDSRVYCKTL